MTSNSLTPMSLDCTELVLSQAETTDGITTTKRLEEITSAIAKANSNFSKEEKPSPNPNCADALTYWHSLVNAVAATSNEECIRHFVNNLNGLALITDWIHMAQKLGNEETTDDVNMGSSDKLVVSLLNLLNRLPTETCMLADGGMPTVLKELGLSKSSTIKEMALALHDKWRPAEEGSASSHPLPNSNIPETSESLKDEPQKSNHSANHDVSGSPMKRKSDLEGEEEKEAEEQMNSPSEPTSPAYSSDTGSMPDIEPVVSPDKENKVEAVYDDDMDALEIARQVAIQVEEEVVQYRETLCSSPEEETQPGVDLPLTKAVEGKTDQNAVDHVCSTHPREEDSALTRVQEDGQVKSSKADGSGLDLNENLCADYDTAPELIHVAASKGVPPSSSIPVSSSRFVAGTAAGWKGTAAATSAFRPASPRSAALPSGTSTPVAEYMGQKQKSSSCLAFEFDLNVAETNAAEVTLPPSGDSSNEVSSGQAKRLKLDLNCANEDEVIEPIPSQLPQNQISSNIFLEHGHSASSSSLRNQTKFDFDLNDDLSYRKDEGQSGNSVKLMGWNMAGGTVLRNQSTPPMFHSFLGPNAAPSPIGSFSGPNMFHAQMMPSSSYGFQYNAAPSGWYGQPSTSYAVAPHFVPPMVSPVSQNGPSIGLSLVPGDRSNFLHPSLDLNATTGSVEVTSSSQVGFRHLFMQNHSGSVQEQGIAATAQPTAQTPGNGVRWREQEHERETFSYSFKQPI